MTRDPTGVNYLPIFILTLTKARMADDGDEAASQFYQLLTSLTIGRLSEAEHHVILGNCLI